MTREEIMAMTAKELRFKIAELLGWKGLLYGLDDEILSGISPNDSSGLTSYVPHWDKSIADIYVLEEEYVLGDDRDKYGKLLTWIINEDDSIIDYRWELIHADPITRCRAWLMWKLNARNKYICQTA